MKIVNILQVFSLILITIAKANETSQDQTEKDPTNFNAVKSLKKAETKTLKHEKLSRQSISLWPNIEEDQDLLLLEQVLQDIQRGHGKSQKYKKLTKFMYPLFMGVFVAKIVLVPLLLKTLTAISASAVIMSKIAFITTAFVALKWIFSENVYDTKDRFEFIYLPTSSSTSSSNGKPYRYASGSFSPWDDQSWSDSDNQYVAAVAPANIVQQQKYIPVNIKHELPHKTYRDGQTNGQSLGNSIKDLYYYAQHNYNKNNFGKPFL